MQHHTNGVYKKLLYVEAIISKLAAAETNSLTTVRPKSDTDNVKLLLILQTCERLFFLFHTGKTLNVLLSDSVVKRVGDETNIFCNFISHCRFASENDGQVYLEEFMLF